MSMRVYEFSFSSSKKFRVTEPYGGGQGTYITPYWSTGVNSYRFYYYKSLTGGKYIQEIWRQSNTGTWSFDARSPSTTASAVPPYTSISTEPRTVGWTGSSYEGLATTVTAIDIYTANITANAYGTVSRAKLFYDISAQRSSTATPNEGSSFIGWFLTGTETQVTTNDDFTVSSNTITLKRAPVSADIAVEARFTAVYLLTTSTSNAAHGQGYIGDSPSTDTTRWLASGSTQNIRAVATNPAYKFSKWTVDGYDFSTSANVQITTESFAETYVAVFIPINYALDVTVQASEQGSVSVDGQISGVTTGLSIPSLSGVTVRATAAFGYEFIGWYKAGVLQSSSAVYSFTMPEATVALEARFVILATAPMIITKTKGLIGAADAKDMGSVTQYHLESVFDTTSAVGTATLVSNLFNTKSYKFVPTPADSDYQFDGWYQTVDGSEVAITTGGIFTVDGNNLYILPTTTDAIAVNAQFSERSFCEITPVASDSSVYEASNPAETAGCTCAVSTLPPDDDNNSNGLHDSGDRWLSGQTITVEARQASGWELRSWIVKRVSDGVTVASKAKGDPGFGQTFSFNLLSDVQVVAVSAYTLPADQMQIQALLKSGQPLVSGTLEIHPCGENYVELANGATANVEDGALCELTAIPANGYRFVSWRVAAEDGTVVSAVPVYTFTVTASQIYYAEFEATGFDAMTIFEGADGNKSAVWRGKTYVSSMPVNFSSAKVYADGYPVAVDIGAAQSPLSPHHEPYILRSVADSQDPFRLPSRRREKYAMIGVETTSAVSAVAVATSMEDLKNG